MFETCHTKLKKTLTLVGCQVYPVLVGDASIVVVAQPQAVFVAVARLALRLEGVSPSLEGT
jgi:hypothetical protein